ncbi:MAG: hypothetical protein NWF10_00075 [Candidatus Bathyarchaeota archaeon]|nr:hypothetical protein [Candidatus Bathyarchaeota archaeon]
MDAITVSIQTEIRPTESIEKVKRAVSNIFTNIKPIIKKRHNSKILLAELEGEESLIRFSDMLELDHIRDAARKALSKGISEKTIVFFLNKQVAFVNHISFSEEVAESPLDPIRVKINCDKPKSLVNWLAPKTT